MGWWWFFHLCVPPPAPLPYLITLRDPVSNFLQLFHRFLILEVVGECFGPFLEELDNLGSKGLELCLGKTQSS